MPPATDGQDRASRATHLDDGHRGGAADRLARWCRDDALVVAAMLGVGVLAQVAVVRILWSAASRTRSVVVPFRPNLLVLVLVLALAAVMSASAAVGPLSS